MRNRTYQLIEVVGVAQDSYAEAINYAIDRASQTLKGLGWLEVTAHRGLIPESKVSAYQVMLNVGFR